MTLYADGKETKELKSYDCRMEYELQGELRM